VHRRELSLKGAAAASFRVILDHGTIKEEEEEEEE